MPIWCPTYATPMHHMLQWDPPPPPPKWDCCISDHSCCAIIWTPSSSCCLCSVCSVYPVLAVITILPLCRPCLKKKTTTVYSSILFLNLGRIKVKLNNLIVSGSVQLRLRTVFTSNITKRMQKTFLEQSQAIVTADGLHLYGVVATLFSSLFCYLLTSLSIVAPQPYKNCMAHLFQYPCSSPGMSLQRRAVGCTSKQGIGSGTSGRKQTDGWQLVG